MNIQKWTRAAACGGLATLAAWPVSQLAWAQDTANAEAGDLTEILVTARKREEELIDVPISIRALSAEELTAAGVTDLRSLQQVAGFSFPPQVGTAAAGRALGVLIFRGLAGDTSLPQDNSGSLFIDGIFISGGFSSVNMADVERVEVLKGPQNAYFGRSTFGGLVNLITANPKDQFGARVNAELTDRGTNNFDLSVEGPIAGDWLSGRLMVLSHNRAGQYRASDGGVLGDERSQSITGTLYAKPSESLWIRLRGHYQEDDDGTAAFAYIKGTNCTGFTYPALTAAGANAPFRITLPGQCGPVPELDSGNPRVVLDANTALPAAAIGPQTANTLGDPFLSKAPVLDSMGMRRDTLRLSLQSGYEFANGWDLEGNLGFNDADTTTAWDLDRTAVRNFFNAQPYVTSDVTADVRLSTDPERKVRGLVGASYFRSTFRTSQIDLNAAFGATSYTLNLGNFANTRSSVPAVYASVEWDVLDSLTFSADVRQQKDEIVNLSRATGAEIRNSTEDTLPRLTVSWKPNDDTNLYVTYAEGVQPLALNLGFVNATPLQRSFLQGLFPNIDEYSAVPKLESYEIGVKQSLFDDRLQYTLALYDSDWSNRITFTPVFNPDFCNGPPLQQFTPACPFGVAGSSQTLGNDARVRGAELNVQGRLTDRWTATLDVTYNDATWDSYFNAAFGGFITPVTPGTAPPRRFDGNTLAKTPDVVASLSSTYRAPLSSDWEWFVRGDMRYQGRMWDSDLNITQSDAFVRLFARIGIQKGATTIELYGNNLTNNLDYDFIYRLPDLALTPLTNFNTQGLGAVLPGKREFGVRASFSFD